MNISEIEDILPRYQEIADGVKKSFNVAFDLIDTKFVSVYLGSDKQTSGFNIDIENKAVVFDSAPNSGLLVTIVRAVPVSWESTLHGAINSASINRLLTHIIASIQTVQEEVSRAVKSNVYDQNEGGQLSEFFLKQLTDAQDILNRSENTLSLLNTTTQNALSSVETASSTALSSIGSAKDSALASMEDLVTSAEESEANAKVSETNAKASETKAKQIVDSIVDNSANKDLSNLSTTGQAKFDAKQNVANLSQTLDTSTTKYPSNNAVKTAVDTKQDISNLSQTLDTSTTKYPSNNAVKTQLDLKANNSDALHKTGDETKSGVLAVKQLITNEGNGVVIKGTDYNYTLRSTGPYPNGCALIKNNDINYAAFNATDKFVVGSPNIHAEIGYMPSDSSSTTSKELVPAGWVNSRITSVMDSKLKVVSALPSSPATGVFYYVTE